MAWYASELLTAASACDAAEDGSTTLWDGGLPCVAAWLGVVPGAWPAAIAGTAIDKAITAAATGAIFSKFIDITFLKGFEVSATTDLIVVR